MNTTVKVKNLGNIKDAKINIGDLTIFAGTNTTGKSYVSRALYSIFSALKADPYKAYYSNILRNFGDKLSIQSSNYSQRYRRTPGSARRYSDIRGRVSQMVEDFFADNVSGIIERISRKPQGSFVYKESKRMQKLDDWNDIKKLIEPIFEKEEQLYRSITSILHDAEGETLSIPNIRNEYEEVISFAFKQLKRDLNVTKEDSRSLGFGYLALNNLKDNFQVYTLRDLIGIDAKQETTIQLEYAGGEFTLDFGAQTIKARPNIKKSLVFPKIIYLESPVYWKLRRPLSRMLYSYRERSRYLNGVPGFFYDAVWELLNPIDRDLDESSPLDELTKAIESIIGGEITLTDTEELRFTGRPDGSTQKEEDGEEGISNGRGLDLLLTASGTVQLGMIGLLIKKGAIDKGSILFMDEPEAHLHTDWQQKFMGIIYELVKYGVNVVMATHSPVMMQKLELLEMSEEDSKPDVALNFFPSEGEFDSTKKDYRKVKGEIAKSLEDPIYEMYLRKIYTRKTQESNEK